MEQRVYSRMPLYQLMDIPVTEIQESDWDIRRYKEDSKDLEDLTNSILKDGLLSPIILHPIQNGFEVIAGRRRLRACKKANFDKIPSLVMVSTVDGKEITKADLHRITFNENIRRKELRDTERAYGIVKRFEDYGYTAQDVIRGVKSIDNWFTQHTSGKQDWDALIQKSFLNKESIRKRDETSPLRFDRQFIEICKDVGYSPKYQYQLLQLILQIPVDIMETAEQEGLSSRKKLLLAHTKLRKYPQLQKSLIDKIKDKKIDESKARNIVHRTINDVESGYLQPSDTGKGYHYGDPAKRDIISPKTEKQPSEYHMKSHDEIKRLLFLLTGRALSKGETKYTGKMVQDTHNHRLAIAKSLDSEYRALYGYYSWYLIPLKIALDDMIEILNAELDTAEKKKGMMER